MNPYTILNGCGDIFDEKSGKKEKGREEQIGECLFAISQYMAVEISLKKNLERKKKNKYREEQKGEGPFSIPPYNLSL